MLKSLKIIKVLILKILLYEVLGCV